MHGFEQRLPFGRAQLAQRLLQVKGGRRHARRRGGGALEAHAQLLLQHGEQVFLLDRLAQEAVGAGRQRLLLFFFEGGGGHDHQARLHQRRLRAQPARQRQTIHVRHAPVAQHHVIALRRQHGLRLRAARRFLQLETQRRQQAGQQLAAVVVIVDQQHHAPALGRRQARHAARCQRRDGRLLQHRRAQVETEYGAGTQGGVDAQLAAHQAHEFARNGQPQSRAGLRHGAVGLHERFKDALQIRLRDAAARIAHGKRQRHLPAFCRLARQRQGHAALLDELERVRQQIEQHLAQLGAIEAHQRRHAGTFELQRDALVARTHAHHLEHLVEQAIQVHGPRLQLHAARFDFRQFEDVVDQGQQMMAGAVDDGQVMLFFLEHAARIGHHLRKTDHGIQGRAQFVAHVGQEDAFRAICRFGLGDGHRQGRRALLHQFFQVVAVAKQFLLAVLALGNVDDAAAHQAPPFHGQFDQPHLAGKNAAVGTPHIALHQDRLAQHGAAQMLFHHQPQRQAVGLLAGIQVERPACQQRCARQAQHALRAAVGVDEAVQVQVVHQDGFRRMLDQDAEALLALARIALGAPQAPPLQQQGAQQAGHHDKNAAHQQHGNAVLVPQLRRPVEEQRVRRQAADVGIPALQLFPVIHGYRADRRQQGARRGGRLARQHSQRQLRHLLRGLFDVQDGATEDALADRRVVHAKGGHIRQPRQLHGKRHGRGDAAGRVAVDIARHQHGIGGQARHRRAHLLQGQVIEVAHGHLALPRQRRLLHAALQGLVGLAGADGHDDGLGVREQRHGLRQRAGKIDIRLLLPDGSRTAGRQGLARGVNRQHGHAARQRRQVRQQKIERGLLHGNDEVGLAPHHLGVSQKQQITHLVAQRRVALGIQVQVLDHDVFAGQARGGHGGHIGARVRFHAGAAIVVGVEEQHALALVRRRDGGRCCRQGGAGGGDTERQQQCAAAAAHRCPALPTARHITHHSPCPCSLPPVTMFHPCAG